MSKTNTSLRRVESTSRTTPGSGHSTALDYRYINERIRKGEEEEEGRVERRRGRIERKGEDV